MFEKEAENSFKCKKVLYKWETDKRSYIDGFKDGAQFGYNKCKEELNQNGLALQFDMDKTIEQNIALKKELNKANEWHYVKNGDLTDKVKELEAQIEKMKCLLNEIYSEYGFIELVKIRNNLPIDIREVIKEIK